MIDDLVTRGVSEPYRMFTSRAEYRLKLRADNADQRLTPLGVELGCVGGVRANAFQAKLDQLNEARATLAGLDVTPTEAAKLGFLVKLDGRRRAALELLGLPEFGRAGIARIWPGQLTWDESIWAPLEAEAHYSGYLDRQDADIAALRRDEALTLPMDLAFENIAGLSTEIRQRLHRIRPATVGQAARIEGVTPSAIAAILGHLRKTQTATAARQPA
jgi:tRNA uridine 5-carboxymethylaminomethyl modification enzyme